MFSITVKYLATLLIPVVALVGTTTAANKMYFEDQRQAQFFQA